MNLGTTFEGAYSDADPDFDSNFEHGPEYLSCRDNEEEDIWQPPKGDWQYAAPDCSYPSDPDAESENDPDDHAHCNVPSLFSRITYDWSDSDDDDAYKNRTRCRDCGSVAWNVRYEYGCDVCDG